MIAAAVQLIEIVPGKWKNAASLSLKTDESAALPVFLNHAWPGRRRRTWRGSARRVNDRTRGKQSTAPAEEERDHEAAQGGAATAVVADGGEREGSAKKRKATDAADGDDDELSDDERAAAAFDAVAGTAPLVADTHSVSRKKAKAAATGAKAPPRALKAKSPLVRAAVRDAKRAPAEATSPPEPAMKAPAQRCQSWTRRIHADQGQEASHVISQATSVPPAANATARTRHGPDQTTPRVQGAWPPLASTAKGTWVLVSPRASTRR